MANKPIIDNSVNNIKSRHNTSCNWTGTADFGRLVPFHVEELINDDKVITCRPRIEMQMLPLASPTFGKMDLYVHYFFVPTRLLWKDFENFEARQGPGKDGTPPYWTCSALHTYYNSQTSAAKRGLFKHWTSMGLPPFFALPSNATGIDNQVHYSQLPFRAYSRIWWDYYRDPEVLRDESQDYYLNTAGGAVNFSGGADQAVFDPKVRTLKDNWIANLFAQSGNSPDSFFSGLVVDDPDSPYSVITQDEDPNNSAQQLRKIEALTRLSERLSLGGKRQIDALFAAYGVKPQFDKLSMSQYVGGSKATVLVSDITSSANTATGESGVAQGSPLGAKAGAGYCALSDLNINFHATEAGYLIGLFSVMPHIHYCQGLNKSWIRNKVTDWFTKELEHTGLVAVSKREIAMKSLHSLDYNPTQDGQTFAFSQPYYEYKHGQDILAGDFAYYHNVDDEDAGGVVLPDLQYMHSLCQYIDYPTSRTFNYNSLKVDGTAFNQIFYYLGGSVWSDSDDHFHLCIDKQVIKENGMDGFAVPTVETTSDPHKKAQPLGSDTVL